MLYTDMRLWYLSYQLNAIVLYIRINNLRCCSSVENCAVIFDISQHSDALKCSFSNSSKCSFKM